jgi:hypothetical protein
MLLQTRNLEISLLSRKTIKSQNYCWHYQNPQDMRQTETEGGVTQPSV